MHKDGPQNHYQQHLVSRFCEHRLSELASELVKLMTELFCYVLVTEPGIPYDKQAKQMFCILHPS